MSVDDWLTDLRSHSYTIDLAESQRAKLMEEVESILRSTFADGTTTIPYQTRVWMARLA